MTQSNAKIAEVGKNAREKESLIWNIANSLYGAFKPHEYGLVILPMAIISAKITRTKAAPRSSVRCPL